jgi:lipopolysaccharide transport system permease protein
VFFTLSQTCHLVPGTCILSLVTKYLVPLMPTTIIQPRHGLSALNLKELIRYRELFFTFVERDFKVRYKQTVIGAAWAILQPLTTMVLFSFFFGKIAKIPSDGIPYPVFSYAGLLLWTYFSNAVNVASSSVTSNAGLISKVYFPRLIIPLSSTMVGLIDYGYALLILFGLMFAFGFFPTAWIILLPVVLLTTWMLATGVGLWLAATNVLYRDVKIIISFILQLWIYATPVIYPLSVAGNFRWIVVLNPMTGLIESHRAIFLGTPAIPWISLAYSVIAALVIFWSGMVYFKSIERRFADEI